MGRYDAYSSPHSDEQEAEVTPASLREDSVTQQSLEKVEASTYDTLYSNAEVGDTPFSNVRVTEMTLDELVAFSKPSGEYGKWVKPNSNYFGMARLTRANLFVSGIVSFSACIPRDHLVYPIQFFKNCFRAPKATSANKGEFSDISFRHDGSSKVLFTI